VNRIGSDLLSAAARREDRCSEREWRRSRDLRGRLAKQGPRYLRWALVEAATHACTHPIYRERYQQLMARWQFARRDFEAAEREAYQDARLDELEPQSQPASAPIAAAPDTDALDKLAKLHEEGAL
jgi:hypothetical protein